MDSSSAVILSSTIYNIGGLGYSNSVLWCDLNSIGKLSWKPLELHNYNFKDYYYRAALALGNKIVYFGSNNTMKTFVLEKDE